MVSKIIESMERESLSIASDEFETPTLWTWVTTHELVYVGNVQLDLELLKPVLSMPIVKVQED